MLSLPSFLAFLMPLPAIKDAATAARRRRHINAMRLSPHLLRDVGFDEHDTLVDDPRWVQRFDLER